MAAAAAAQASTTHAGALYRAIWRWHFYAGLLVLPLLAWLAVTGAGFVYHRPLDRLVHHQLLVVAPAAPGERPATPQRIVQAALAAQPGQVFRYTTPAAADASAEVGIVAPDGARRVVYVDPVHARVLGSLADRGTFGWTLRRLHSLDLLGDGARALVELAAGWAIVLVLTGVYLWWPRGTVRIPSKRAPTPERGRTLGGVVTVRGRPSQRLFWRDLHAVVGIGAGAAVLFLAMSGMPWSWLWGAQVNKLVNGHNFGYPAGLRVQLPMSQARVADSADQAWSLQQARVPQSAAHVAMADMPGMEHAGHGAGHASAAQPGAIGLDRAVAAFDARGIGAGYSVSMPQGARGAYTASLYNGVLDQQRVIHLDQYSGRTLLDMRYADYGPAAKALEWGINVHMGDEFGSTNRVLLVLACACTLVLCISAAVMWWKRRPRGGLGVPPLPAQPRTLKVVAGMLAVGGVLFPLVGASWLVMLAVDLGWVQPRQRARRA
ncbi:PepSY-associated TM helix domain-containing protein [Pseudoxanthomonas winnipegensis]|uniref:PepSY domain-containing protein n=1 Tax=Pseudoxanthomonas winnipegensis TaxID=2480810 RepID=A0A4Q8M6L5_9GAMM|nr:PepSY domain-containing protein [Pseudoxanthomonas winnipegensis]TAA45363.1 PepSY domain-containing protein [Pseudoxanthomonas winnipegensis]